MTLPLEGRTPGVDAAVSKIFRRVVPLFIVMLICNQLNRSNIGYAQTHLEADVGIGAAAYGFGAGLFFVAYAIFEVPSNMLMEKFGAKVWLTRIMLSWGLVSAAMMFVNGPVMFYVLRFLLGVAEAGFFPAIIFYFTRWLPNHHRGRATALFVAGSSIAAAISGPLSGPLLSMDGVLGHRGWQWMFALEGLLSVVVGLIAYRLLDSRVQDATWLTASEKTELQATIDREDAVREALLTPENSRRSKWRLMVEPRILVCCGIYFCISMAIYANTFWLPSIIRRIPGTTDVTVGLLSSLPWICAIFAMYLSNRAADRNGRYRLYLVIALLIGALGTMLAAFVSPWLALPLLCLATMGFKSASPLFWSIPQRTLHPAVLAPAIAIVNSLGNLGGFVAPFGFGVIKEQTGSVTMGLIILSLFAIAAAGAVAFFRNDVADAPGKHDAESAAASGTRQPSEHVSLRRPTR